MKVEHNFDTPIQTELELGDVIEWCGDFYLVIRIYSDEAVYCAKTFDGQGTLFGHCDSLQTLNTEFKRVGKESIVYKKSEFKLQLVRA